jgi:hypothetical protein
MAEEPIPEDVKTVIKETFFKELKNDVALEVYTRDGVNDKFNEAAVTLIMALAGLSDKLKVSSLRDEQSMGRSVHRSPTVLAPDNATLRGAPLGEEGRLLPSSWLQRAIVS